MIQMGLRLVQMLGKKLQADDVVQDLGTSRKPAAFDNADGSIWAIGEKGFLDHPKKFQEVACSPKASFGRL